MKKSELRQIIREELLNEEDGRIVSAIKAMTKAMETYIIVREQQVENPKEDIPMMLRDDLVEILNKAGKVRGLSYSDFSKVWKR